MCEMYGDEMGLTTHAPPLSLPPLNPLNQSPYTTLSSHIAMIDSRTQTSIEKLTNTLRW